jgi:phage terminase large subunit-like protein
MRLHSWDTANKATELSDYSVCTCWGIFNRHFYLLDIYRRMNYPELRESVIALARRDRQSTVLIEDKASGTSLLQDLRSAGIESARAYSAPGASDKIMRLHGQTARQWPCPFTPASTLACGICREIGVADLIMRQGQNIFERA